MTATFSYIWMFLVLTHFGSRRSWKKRIPMGSTLFITSCTFRLHMWPLILNKTVVGETVFNCISPHFFHAETFACPVFFVAHWDIAFPDVTFLTHRYIAQVGVPFRSNRYLATVGVYFRSHRGVPYFTHRDMARAGDPIRHRDIAPVGVFFRSYTRVWKHHQ